QENTPDTLAYICVYDPANKRYSTAACTHDIQDISFSLPDTHPLIKWLEEHERSIFYSEFVRTITYKSMWDEEKKLLSDLRIDFILPHICDDTLAGVTLFCIGDPLHHFGYGEINFLESSAAILSIALKNASLYSAMQSEARQDALTGLLNRGYFSERIKKEFLLARHDIATLAMINLDDFRLYNELYGVWEGDALLQQVASNLRAIIGSRGIIARYSGKEFAVFLPFCDACIVQSLLENLRDLMNSQKRDEKFVTFTAGICSYPASACSIDELFTYASMAVYSGKRNGKNRIVVYSPGIVSTDTAPASKRALAENCASTIYALTAAIDAKDHYTFSHSQNVSDYASILAEAIPLDPEHVEIIRQAGLLHDIGKIGIPEAILSKTSQLTSCEYAIMKTHAEGATAMIRHLPSLDYVIPTATGHHERWDGKGYPRGLSGEMIPVGARCLCLADAFDAMTSKRSYKEARSVPDALAEIRKNLGTQFDPKLGTLFIELVESGKILVHPTTSIPESDLFQASRVQGVVPPTVLTDTPS
ncbi:MAG: diguanylate cyclase, partial [Pygmaiobacter sp.]